MADHYAVLEIQQTATGAEITAAYRRLAMVHHPDKNPGNIAEATERFQKIQTAYQVLSDDSSRLRYDARRNTNVYANSTYTPYTTGSWDADDEDDGGDGFGQYFNEFLFAWIFGPPRRPGYGFDEAMESARERQRRQEEREREREEWREERDRREREATRKRDAKLATKQAQQAEIEKAWRAEFEQEAHKQQVRWQLAGAVTKQAKLSTCLHSVFCEKIKQPRKFKCGACSVKRGKIAFECPHCACHLCQLCVSKFAEKRAMDEKPKPSDTRPMTPDSSRSEEQTGPDSRAVPNHKYHRTDGVPVNSTTSDDKSKRAARSHQSSPIETHKQSRSTTQGQMKTPTKPQNQAEKFEDISLRPGKGSTVKPEPQPQENDPLDMKPNAHGGRHQGRIAKGIQPNAGSKNEPNSTAPTDSKQEEEITSQAANKRLRDRKPRPRMSGLKDSNATAPISKPRTPGAASKEAIKENIGGRRHEPEERTTGENPKPKRCFNCGKPGHFAAVCRQPRDAPKDAAAKRCYNCGKPGHVAAACRQSRHVSQESAA